jgi:hypothetical protein
VLAASLGCSFISVRGPSATDSGKPSGLPDCTASEDAPKGDAAIATVATFLFVVATLIAIEPCTPARGLMPADCAEQHNGRLGALAAVPTAAAFWISSEYGFRKTNECHELRQASIR